MGEERGLGGVMCFLSQGRKHPLWTGTRSLLKLDGCSERSNSFRMNRDTISCCIGKRIVLELGTTRKENLGKRGIALDQDKR